MHRRRAGPRGGLRAGQLSEPPGPYWVRTRTPESRALFERVKVATRLSAALGAYTLDDAATLQRLFEELTGRAVGTGFVLVPPFYTDHGLGISVGSRVFVGSGCAFTGHAPIEIADDVMVAHRVNLVTAGHPVAPAERRDWLTAAPVRLEANVWVGAAATVLQGVTVGAGAVVAAGAVVTRDVPPATLVAGVPARVVREL